MLLGKIYKIITGTSNECYVGSTFEKLRYRLQRHKKNYQSWKENKTKNKTLSSVYMFDKYGIDECKIILIKEYQVVDRTHLEAYEQLWINKLNSININPTLNIVKLNARKNREKESNKIRVKTWMEENKEHRQAYMKEYYQKTKEKYRESKTCGCGGKYSEAYYPAHCRTNRHKNWIAEL